MKQLLTVITLAAFCSPTSAKPLKVYLLVGQSNMQGHAAVRTLAHLGMDLKTAPLLKAIQNADSSAKVHDQIWISSIDTSEESGVKEGKLTVGYGAGGREPKIGPELTFGITMQKHVGKPILLIKTSWGGKSLNTDFRPPSAGAYTFNEKQIENLKKRGKDLAEARREKDERTGVYYRLMLGHIRKVLGDIKRVYPKYDAKSGHELAGFVWFQGWNDMVDSGTYPTRGQPGSYDAYSKNLAHFIRDVRKNLKAPKLPFVIGVMGAGGPIAKYSPDQMRYSGIHGEFRKAMAAPSKLPEFKDNVTAVFTENYWDGQLSELVDRRGKINAKRRELAKDQSLTREQRDKAIGDFTDELFSQEELKILEVGTSNAAYHYLGSAKILGQIGRAFADALAKLD
ncbi:MAG: sialate O-acetylesterase [Verrucomicrobiota bacterium]|nr:sialate O-acetylesterase [Verrucomicrobiota bacterium]MDP7050161.1 sialate O-acetylesterase [Verrucomicrobiota bacterium]